MDFWLRVPYNRIISKNEGIDISERYAGQYRQLIRMMQEIPDRDEMGFDLTTMSYDDDEDPDDEDGE